MRIFWLCCALLTAAATGGWAALTPVACEGAHGLLTTSLYGTFPVTPAAHKDGDGLVSTRALVCSFKHGDAAPVLVALDSEKPAAKRLALIRFDFSGEGKFAASNVTRLLYRDAHSAMVAETTLQVPRDGRLLAVQITGNVDFDDQQQVHINLNLGAALQGTGDFGGKRYPVRLVDGNSSLHFGNILTGLATPAALRKWAESPAHLGSDLVYVDTGNGSFAQPDTLQQAYYGYPIYVNRAWYDVRLAADGTQFVVKPYAGTLGRVKMPHAPWSAQLLGDTCLLELRDMPQQATLPAGHYFLCSYSDVLPADKTRKEPLAVDYQFYDAQKTKWLTVPANGVVTLKIGMPVTFAVNGTRHKDNIDFAVAMLDCAGDPVSVNLKVGGWGCGKMAFTVRNAKGEQVYSGAFEHG